MKSRCSGWPKDHGSNSYSLRIAIWDSFCAYGISSLVVRPLVSCLLYLTNPLLPCSILVPGSHALCFLCLRALRLLCSCLVFPCFIVLVFPFLSHSCLDVLVTFPCIALAFPSCPFHAP
ncbi:hypothetical protein ARMGADRAFT_102872 [Armillaria gallica]|uniref:Transmembrane protein n=1 Tax=Armillaria gallica TaxID=47427 RepID=A0A2H3CUM1_ARMGA|nr:hypothetical protein ARMGADRAFT_102872 [Armillaria gallica]